MSADHFSCQTSSAAPVSLAPARLFAGDQHTQMLSLPEHALRHHHAYHQLVFGLEGNTEFDLAGHRRPVTLGAGCILPASTEHVFQGWGQNHILVVNLSTQQETGVLEAVERLFACAHYFDCPPDLLWLLRALTRQISAYPQDTRLHQACGHTLICALNQHLGMQQTWIRTGKRLNLAHIDDYIDAHLDRKIQVSELAGLMCLSLSQFQYRFREQVGMPAQTYINQRRLTQIAQVLTSCERPLSQIAHEFGFAHQSALTKAFSQYFGISPARYRTQYTRL